MYIFASGFIDPEKNQDGEEFGIFAALADGTVIEFPIFTQDVPDKVNLSAPLNNAAGVATKGNLSWSVPEETDSYNVQISETNTFETTVADEKKILINVYSFSGLQEEKKYYWRVQGVNIAGEGEWSDAWSFTTKKNVAEPGKVTLLSPANNSTDQPKSGTVSWEALEEADDYDIEIATDSDFENVVADSTTMEDTEYNYYGLQPGTKYYWRVIAFNTAGGGEWSDIWSFTTRQSAGKPGQAALASPENNATDQPKSGEVKWNAVENADKYSIEFATDESFDNVILDDSEIPNTKYEYSHLEDATKYYWHVKAHNSEGGGDWSDTWAFTTVNGTSVDNETYSKNTFIFPNPAADFIEIIVIYDVKTQAVIDNPVQILNVMGITVETARITSDRTRIDISGLTSGIYFVRIGDRTEKFIKL